MKRKLFTMLLIALLCLGNTMAAFAVTNNSNTDELRKNMIIDSHIEALLNGEIDAKHRDSDTDINIKLGEVEKAPLIGEMPQYGTFFEEQDINLIKQDVTVDTFKLDGNKEEYLATFIVNSKYEKKSDSNTSQPFVTKSDGDIFCDIEVAFSLIYEKINLPTSTGVKVTRLIGKYVKSTDPQMKCSKLDLKYATFGLWYDGGGKVITGTLPTSTLRKERTITSPAKGANYMLDTNFAYYVECPPGYFGGRLFYTVKRTVSSYTSEQYIALDFGEVPNLFEKGH